MKIDSTKRISKEIDQIMLSDEQMALKQLEGILEKLPIEISNFINEAFTHKRVPKEYLFSSILFAFSNAAGLAFEINTLGHKNFANLYFAIIGNRGDAKSVGMKLATDLLSQIDSANYKEGTSGNMRTIS